MANIKFSTIEWKTAKEYFEAGLSLSKIVAKTRIDKGAISRKAKTEGWIKNNAQKQQLIFDAVRVCEAKSGLNQQALKVHDELVDEMIHYRKYFTNATILNINIMMKKINESTSIVEHRHAQATIKEGREAILGKGPDLSIQVNAHMITPVNLPIDPIAASREYQRIIRGE